MGKHTKHNTDGGATERNTRRGTCKQDRDTATRHRDKNTWAGSIINLAGKNMTIMTEKKKITKKSEKKHHKLRMQFERPRTMTQTKKRKKYYYYFSRNMTVNCFTVSSPLSKNVNGLKTEDS